MCDFHSIIVRRDGAKAHVMTNSHSQAVEHANWRENDRMADMRGPFFVECEWGGIGEYPGADKITRSCSFNEKQRKTIDSHYGSLAKLLANVKDNSETMLGNGGVFEGNEYGDIRWKVLISDDCPKSIAQRLAESALHADGSTIKSLHPAIKTLRGGFTVKAGHHIDAPLLTEVSGYVIVAQGATFTAPLLTEVSGYVIVEQGATFTAPKLKR